MQNSTATPPPSVLPAIQPEQRPEGLVLKETGGGCQTLFLVVFTVMWNVIAWPIAIGVFVASRSGAGPSPVLLIVPAIFCLVGLVLLAILVRQGVIASQFKPGELTVSAWPLRLGDDLNVVFRRGVRGNIEVRQVQAKLVCTEVVRYRVGTDTHTAREVVWEEQLPTPALTPGANGVECYWRIHLPDDGPPSFETNNNTVVWSVDVRLHNQLFPDAQSSFSLLVLPEVRA